MYLRRSGWTDRRHVLDPHGRRRGAPADHRAAAPARWTWAARGCARNDFPSGGEDGAGSLEAGGRELSLPVRAGRQPAVRDRGRRRAGAARPRPLSGPRSSATSSFRTAPTCPSGAATATRDIRARIFERGVGETMSSGTGATGAAVAAVLRGVDSPVTVHLDGGELEVDVGEDLHVDLTGWAVPVYAGDAERRVRRGAACEPSSRLDRLPPYLFAELERKIAEKKAAGVDVISLGIGDPDTPTPGAGRRRPGRGRARPGHAPVPLQPRPPRAARGLRPLLRAPLRRGARPGHRDRARARRQGVRLQPQPRLPRPRQRRAGRRPRLPRLHRRAAAGRRRARADAAAARARLRARPRRDLGGGPPSARG